MNTVTYKTTFEFGYIQNLKFNAHRYNLQVIVQSGTSIIDGSPLLSFETLKLCVDKVTEIFRDSLLYGTDTDENVGPYLAGMEQHGVKVEYFNDALNVENFCSYIAKELEKILKKHVGYDDIIKVSKVTLNETPQFSASYENN